MFLCRNKNDASTFWLKKYVSGARMNLLFLQYNLLGILQEAFKAVEDIHGLISLSKKAPRPSLMANYYMKLGLVFWKSGNHLFHACTLHRHFLLAREQRKNLSQEEQQK